MLVINARNVNDAYFLGLKQLLAEGRTQYSRNGPVLVMDTPVTTVYSQPQERVLFDPDRDANPFFHLFESLWMLAGRDDARWLDHFVKNFSSRFAENGIQHGAYGQRWRNHFGFDQLDAVVEILARNHDDRQCVLQMWDATYADPEDRYEIGADDLTGNWRDRPCNTHIYLRVHGGVLDITVLCRSNDIIWGAYGANAVHFSMLHEYLAGRIGVDVGTYYQVSNNFHAYEDTLAKVGVPTPFVGEYPTPTPVVTEPVHFDDDLQRFMDWTDKGYTYSAPEFKNSWFSATAVPMFLAFTVWRKHKDVAEALSIVERASAFGISPDWQQAGIAWLNRHPVKP